MVRWRQLIPVNYTTTTTSVFWLHYNIITPSVSDLSLSVTLTPPCSLVDDLLTERLMWALTFGMNAEMFTHLCPTALTFGIRVSWNQLTVFLFPGAVRGTHACWEMWPALRLQTQSRSTTSLWCPTCLPPESFSECQQLECWAIRCVSAWQEARAEVTSVCSARADRPVHYSWWRPYWARLLWRLRWKWASWSAMICSVATWQRSPCLCHRMSFRWWKTMSKNIVSKIYIYIGL